MQRKGFNFFRSYYDVAKELSDKDRLAFYDALILEQFTGIKTELKGMAKFAYISQRHSIDAQIVGFNQRLKRNDTTLQPLSTQPPAIPPMLPPAVQEKEKEKEKEELLISCFSFDEFWSLYPNKVAKEKCKTKYKNLSEKERQQIKDTIQKFINYKPFPSYNHPNPETYINQKRWEDEIREVKTEPIIEETETEFRRRTWLERNGGVNERQNS